MSPPLLNIKLPRPVTSIHQIEITSRCNLKCPYCPHHGMPTATRPKIDMAEATFRRTLAWVAYYRNQGTQGELNLAGIGESTMHPQFIEWLPLAREAIGPNAKLVMATNGLLFTEEIARAAVKSNLRVSVSLHRPEKAGLAIAVANKYGVLEGVSADPSINPNDWAGQVDWTPAKTNQNRLACPWIRSGWVFVLSDGRISRCCLDADGSGVFADVQDPIPGDVPHHAHKGELLTSPWKLCATCYQDINIVGYDQKNNRHLPVVE